MSRAFSVVIPVKDEVETVNRNLYSWICLEPNEIVICCDLPPASGILKALNNHIMVGRNNGVDLRIVQVPKVRGWKFHQAYVRRSGFRAAKHDVILTGDIDLNVTEECLKAVEMVGYDNIGLVSLSKINGGDGVLWLREALLKASRILAHLIPSLRSSYFTGLYALYRPYWLDSEGEGVKDLQNPKYAPFNVKDVTPYTGEDTHLRNRMKLKHRVVYLPEVGAVNCGPSLEGQKDVQIRVGRRRAHDGDSVLRVILHAGLHLRPWLLWGWMLQKVGK